jgi:hypothetical protein
LGSQQQYADFGASRLHKPLTDLDQLQPHWHGPNLSIEKKQPMARPTSVPRYFQNRTRMNTIQLGPWKKHQNGKQTANNKVLLSAAPNSHLLSVDHHNEEERLQFRAGCWQAATSSER